MNKNTISQQGFTLMEFMIIFAVVAILVSIAVASYRPYVLKSHRKAAIADIMELQQELGRQYTLNHGAYPPFIDSENKPKNKISGTCDTAGPYTSGENPITYKMTVTLSQQRQFYEIEAEPCGAQANDQCGHLKLDSTGLRLVKKKDSSYTIDKGCF